MKESEDMRDKDEHHLDDVESERDQLRHDLADAKKELDDIKRRDSENCLEWQDWERWIKEVLTDFKIDFDPHKVGMRIAVTQWMVKALKRPTLEELRTWPCGCNWTYTYGRRIKCEPICPRCQKIEEMERSK